MTSKRAVAEYVERHGITPDHAAGLRSLHFARSTGALVGLYQAAEAGLDESGFATVCEDHSALVVHDTLALARFHASAPESWCDECHDEGVARLTTHDTVTFALSGAAVRLISEGNWPNEQPDAWRSIVASPRARRGKGSRYTVTLDVAIASDLADYLWSVAEVNDVGEGRSASAARTARSAVASITTTEEGAR